MTVAPMDAPAPWARGHEVGSHRILKRIGIGGMAEVYEAEHVTLGGQVAIKRLLTASPADATKRQRFVREGRAAAALHHPNIARVYDLGVEGRTPFLVMEFIQGTNLRTWLHEHAPVAPKTALEVLGPLLDALAFAHSRGIVHRDLKPANVVLGGWPSGQLRPVLVDFGLARGTLVDDGLVTAQDELLGTPAYFAPELCEGASPPSARSDQYALGVIAYECLTGRRPFQGDSLAALVQAILRAPLTPPHALRPELDAALSAPVLRALARDPADRFPSVAMFADALRAALRAPLPSASAPSSRRDARPPHLRLTMIAACALAATLGGAWWQTRRPVQHAPALPVRVIEPTTQEALVEVRPPSPVPTPSLVPSPHAARSPPPGRPVFAPRPLALRRRPTADAGQVRERCVGPNGVNLCL